MTQNLYKEAHIMTKQIYDEYKDVDYKYQFKLCLSYLSDKEITKRTENIMSKVKIDMNEARLLERVEYYYKNLYNSSTNLEFRLWKRHDKKRIYITSIYITDKTYLDLNDKCLYTNNKLLRKF